MNKLLIVLGLLSVPIVQGCNGKGGGHRDNDDNEMTISMSEVPPAVQQSFEKMHPRAKVTAVEKETNADGAVHYEYEFVQDGKQREVELDEKGVVAPEDKD